MKFKCCDHWTVMIPGIVLEANEAAKVQIWEKKKGKEMIS